LRCLAPIVREHVLPAGTVSCVDSADVYFRPALAGKHPSAHGSRPYEAHYEHPDGPETPWTCANVATTMIYTHVLNRSGLSVEPVRQVNIWDGSGNNELNWGFMGKTTHRTRQNFYIEMVLLKQRCIIPGA
jgi:hypothetical protein